MAGRPVRPPLNKLAPTARCLVGTVEYQGSPTMSSWPMPASSASMPTARSRWSPVAAALPTSPSTSSATA